MVSVIWSATKCFVVLDCFFAFYPPMDPENQNFEEKKTKKTPGDIVILHNCITNGNHMMYVHGLQQTIFCHFGLIFALLPPYGPRKSKF